MTRSQPKMANRSFIVSHQPPTGCVEFHETNPQKDEPSKNANQQANRVCSSYRSWGFGSVVSLDTATLICNLLYHVGAVTAAALHAENYFKRIRVFERREAAGGTWYACSIIKSHLLQLTTALEGSTMLQQYLVYWSHQDHSHLKLILL